MNNNLQSCFFVILFQIIGLTSSQFGAIVSSKKVWLWNVWLDMPQFKVHFWKRTIVVNSKIICDEKKSYMFSVIVCVQVFMNCIFYINQLWLLVIFFFYHTCMIFAILIFQLVTLHLHYISLTSKFPFMVSVVFEGWMVKSRPFLVEILNALPHRPDSRTYLKFF